MSLNIVVWISVLSACCSISVLICDELVIIFHCIVPVFFCFLLYFFFLMIRRPPRSTRTDTLFPYTTRFRSEADAGEGPLKLAIVGRPNAGKSTLINRLLEQERLITGPEAGITRDSIAIDWAWKAPDGEVRPVRLIRSEEPTSELQSLMRHSYAVFCLQKKKNIQTQNKK